MHLSPIRFPCPSPSCWKSTGPAIEYLFTHFIHSIGQLLFLHQYLQGPFLLPGGVAEDWRLDRSHLSRKQTLPSTPISMTSKRQTSFCSTFFNPYLDGCGLKAPLVLSDFFPLAGYCFRFEYTFSCNLFIIFFRVGGFILVQL